MLIGTANSIRIAEFRYIAKILLLLLLRIRLMPSNTGGIGRLMGACMTALLSLNAFVIVR